MRPLLVYVWGSYGGRGKMSAASLSVVLVCALLAIVASLSAKDMNSTGAKAVAGVDEAGHRAVFLETKQGRGFLIAYDMVNSQPAFRLEVKHDEPRTWSVNSCDGTLYFTLTDIIYVEPTCHKKGFKYSRSEVLAKFHGWTSMGALYGKWERLDFRTPRGTYRFLVHCTDVADLTSRKTYGKAACQEAGDLWENWVTLIVNNFLAALDQFARINSSVHFSVAAQESGTANPGNHPSSGATAAIGAITKSASSTQKVISPVETKQINQAADATDQQRQLPAASLQWYDSNTTLPLGDPSCGYRLVYANRGEESGLQVEVGLRGMVKKKSEGLLAKKAAGEPALLYVGKQSIALIPEGKNKDNKSERDRFQFSRSDVEASFKTNWGTFHWPSITVTTPGKKVVLHPLVDLDNTAVKSCGPGASELVEWVERAFNDFGAALADFQSRTGVLTVDAQFALKAQEEAAEAAAVKGNLPEALQEYKDALQKLPYNGPPEVRQSIRDKILNLTLQISAQDEAVGDTAEKQVQLSEALRHYVIALQDLPENPPADIKERLREKIVRVDLQMHPDTDGAVSELEKQFGSVPLWAEESFADAAAQRGNLRLAFQYYMSAFQQLPETSVASDRLRQKIIKVVLQVNPAPAIPLDATRHVAYAQAAVEEAEKDANSSHLTDAVNELNKALRIAPWWGVQYKSLAYVLKKQERLSEALEALQLYILADPHAPDEQDIQMEIFRLQYEAREAAKKKSFAEGIEGYWKDEDGQGYQISSQVSANGIHVEIEKGGLHFQGNIDNNGALLGTYRQDSYDDDSLLPSTYIDPDSDAHVCNVPAGQGGFSGSIDSDSSSITLEYVLPYKVHKAVKGCGLCVFSNPTTICTGVTAPGDSRRHVLRR